MKKIKTGQYEWTYKGYLFKITKDCEGYSPYDSWTIQSGKFTKCRSTIKQLQSFVIRNLNYYKNVCQLWTEESMIKAKRIVKEALKDRLFEVKEIITDFEKDKTLNNGDVKVIFMDVYLVKWMIHEIEMLRGDIK